MSHIELRGVRVHNLHGIDLRLPLGKLIAITGVSGAGKSSLAFDTLVAEGRRRYIETFAPSARQFLERIERPDADVLEHLPPAIAFRAESSFDPRATLGTITETDDLLRLLFARVGQAHCPQCDSPLNSWSSDDVVVQLGALPEGTRFVVALPARSLGHSESSDTWRQLGFVRAIAMQPQPSTDSFVAETIDLSELAAHKPQATGNETPKLWIVVDRLIAGKTDVARMLDSVEQAYQNGADRCIVLWETLTDQSPDKPVGRIVNPSEPFADGWSIRPTARTVGWDGREWQFARFSKRLVCFDCDVEFPALEPDHFDFGNSLGACLHCNGLGTVEKDGGWQSCSECGGSRIKALGRGVRLQSLVGRIANPPEPSGGTELSELLADGLTIRPMASGGIDNLRRMTITELRSIIDGLTTAASTSTTWIVTNVLAELSVRLRTLIELGLEHLSLHRSPRSLSRGEGQRASLAALLATRLDNAMYVLDEPASGLHPSEQPRVLAAIRRLQQSGNTVIMVEHQPLFLDAADQIIDLGPGAGRDGGRIVFQGSSTDLRHCQASITGAFLTGRRALLIPTADQRRSPDRWLTLAGATLHNLRGVSVEFPLGVLCVVAGVSGSGKSSLVEHALFPVLSRQLNSAAHTRSTRQRGNRIPSDTDPSLVRRANVEIASTFTALNGIEHIDDVVFLDSSPFRQSARTSAATALQAFGEIRRLFAETTEAKVKNFSARHFSFNAHDGGRCPRCRGLGSVEIDMQFLADLSVVCPECHGLRFQRELLDAKLRGLSIADVLALTADEAFAFFRGHPKLQRRLKSLKDVGLGYLPLGQSASTLSRGESQRLKLAMLLAHSSRARTLFLMDEPTAGLHLSDVATLLTCLRRLIEVGHSLIVIEHRPEFIHCADWVIELGPGPGDAGGRVVSAGPPV